MSEQLADLFIIGGGVNGCGVARDAAGRGLKVVLAEKGDLAGATSSASTKLFHGGLRYLEYFEFRLVRESLRERETLLTAMPHIAWPMRFVLPYDPAMRFETDTPVSRLVSRVMPWMKGRRPAWMIRAGLALYDSLGARKLLPGTKTLDLTTDVAGRSLQPRFQRAFEYSDVWVEDSRLVVLNARDAAARGAEILTRTEVLSARREGEAWRIVLRGPDGQEREVGAKLLINAGGPWADSVLGERLGINAPAHVRLVRGSHIVTRKLFDHDRCYFFQGTDGRIIFAIPYEHDFTLIGTTDQEHHGDPGQAECTVAERDYLCAFASQYLRQPVTPDDIVRSYAGVRPLYDDGVSSATAATRDYVLALDTAGAPLLTVFGGKITTHRRLAESVMAKLSPHIPGLPPAWTAGVPLPGGDFPVDRFEGLVIELQAEYPFLTEDWARRLARAYGTDAHGVLDGAREVAALGRDFGATLTEAELVWLMDREWARRADDVVWRRSKLGLRMTPDQIAAVDDWMQARLD